MDQFMIVTMIEQDIFYKNLSDHHAALELHNIPLSNKGEGRKCMPAPNFNCSILTVESFKYEQN